LIFKIFILGATLVFPRVLQSFFFPVSIFQTYKTGASRAMTSVFPPTSYYA